VAYSDYIKGVGLVEGGPYGSSAGFAAPEPNADKYIKLAEELSAEGRIDSTNNINGAPVFIYSALDDSVNPPYAQ
jgi:hypothetical protein